MVIQNSTIQNQLKMLPSALVDMVYDYTADTGPKELVLGQLGQMAPILAYPGLEVRNRARRVELTQRINKRLVKGYLTNEYYENHI